jgi:hypothetical protein
MQDLRRRFPNRSINMTISGPGLGDTWSSLDDDSKRHMEDMERGVKALQKQHKRKENMRNVGAGNAGKNDARNEQMAKEFQRRRPTSKLSDTALMVDIGRKFKLKRRASIDACKAGLKKLCR